MRVELYDGTPLEFPDGTAPDVVQRTVKKLTFERRAAETNKQQAEFSARGATGGELMTSGINPTEGNSFGKNALIGVGKAISDTGTGIKQLVNEGLDVVAPRSPTMSQLVTGEDPSRSAADRKAYSQTKAQDVPLMNTAGGVLGNVAGNIGVTLAPGGLLKGASVVAKGTQAAPVLANMGRAALVPRTIAGAGGAGAAYGAIQPVGTNDSRTGNTIIGGVAGAAIPAAVKGWQMAKALAAPFHDGGQNQIIGSVLRRAAGNDADNAMLRLASAQELIHGSVPTAGQAAGNAGIAAVERAASAIDGSVTTAYAQRMAQQNAARVNALSGIAGTPQAMQAAETARRTATAPLYAQVAKSTAEADPTRTVNMIDKIIKANPARNQLVSTLGTVRESLFDSYPAQQRASEAWKEVSGVIGKRMSSADDNALRSVRTILDRVRKGTIDADEGFAAIKGVSAKSKTASEAIDRARQFLKTPDDVVRQSPQALQSASKNIGDLLNAKGPNGSKINEAIARELSIVKRSLDRQIAKAEPAYGQAQSTFRTLSTPINQMQVGQEIAESGISPLTGKFRPESFARSLSDETAARATGFKRATLDGSLSPQQRGTLEAIRQDLARANFAQTEGRGVGSDTVQKLAYSNLIDSAGVPTWLRTFAPSQVAGNIAARGADALYGRANREMANKLAMALLDSQQAAMMMRSGTPTNPMLARVLRNVSTPALLSTPALINANKE